MMYGDEALLKGMAVTGDGTSSAVISRRIG